MRKISVLILLILVHPVAMFADQPRVMPVPWPVTLALARPLELDSSRLNAVSQAPTTSRSWISRHPVLFGVLVGVGAGALAGATLGHPCIEESFCGRAGTIPIGAASGGGVGALVGFVVGLAK